MELKANLLGKPREPKVDDTVSQVFRFNSHHSLCEMLNPGACRANELAFKPRKHGVGISAMEDRLQSK